LLIKKIKLYNIDLTVKIWLHQQRNCQSSTSKNMLLLGMFSSCVEYSRLLISFVTILLHVERMRNIGDMLTKCIFKAHCSLLNVHTACFANQNWMFHEGRKTKIECFSSLCWWVFSFLKRVFKNWIGSPNRFFLIVFLKTVFQTLNSLSTEVNLYSNTFHIQFVERQFQLWLLICYVLICAIICLYYRRLINSQYDTISYEINSGCQFTKSRSRRYWYYNKKIILPCPIN